VERYRRNDLQRSGKQFHHRRLGRRCTRFGEPHGNHQRHGLLHDLQPAGRHCAAANARRFRPGRHPGERGCGYSTILVAGHTYQWTVTGGTIQGPSDDASITVLWPSVGVGAVSVEESDPAEGCSNNSGIYEVEVVEPMESFVLSGYVTYNNNANTAMGNVLLTLKLGSQTFSTTLTGADGYYEFPAVPDGSYTISALISQEPGGINSADAGLANYWWTHKTPIQVVKWMSGDVYNADNFINATDAGQIQGHFVFGTPFPRGPWVFWKKPDVSAQNPPMMNATIVVSGENKVQDFYARSTGDFNGSFVPSDDKAGAIAGLQLVSTGAIAPNPGTEFTLPITTISSLEINAISLSLIIPEGMPEISGVLLADGSLGDANGQFQFSRNGDMLRIGWNSQTTLTLSAGQALLTLVMNAPATGIPAQPLQVTLSNDPLNELSGSDFSPIHGVILSAPAIGGNPTGLGDDPVVAKLHFENYPNPFDQTTTLRYTLPESGHVALSITDMYGRRVVILKDELQAGGTHTVQLSGADLTPGVYEAELILKTKRNSTKERIKIIRY
jgi:hypothetical protein